MAIPYPTVRGRRYGYSSIEISLVSDNGAEIVVDIIDVGYSDALEEELVYGTDKAPVGRTPGQYAPGDGTLTLNKQAAAAFLDRLGDGYMEKEIDIVVTYSDKDLPLVTDTLERCRITNIDDSHSQGPGALTEAWTFKPMTVLRNGKTPLENHLR